MNLTRSTGSQYHRSILDAMPHPVIVIEEGGWIVDSNAAARQVMTIEAKKARHRSAGEALGCIHARGNGCGGRPVCETCPVHTCVSRALEHQYPSRQMLKLIVAGDDGMRGLDYMMTVSPLRLENLHLALMVLEDPREIASFPQTLPVCSHCKQVRSDQNDWQSMESYLSSHLEIHCTHSLCPDCARKFFPEYADALQNKRRS